MSTTSCTALVHHREENTCRPEEKERTRSTPTGRITPSAPPTGASPPTRTDQIVAMSDGKDSPTLSFTDVCVDIQNKRVLRDVTGTARRGEILAVMGPSGGGKTTLLNALAGYMPTSAGTILVRGHKINKMVRRRISYVLQSDLFFENLTLRETLLYSAMLRLPSKMTFREKTEKVDHVIESLNLQSCQKTIIGSPLKRGLSGGEKKRTNIACELLTDPLILLLDEPTSGLDSSAAFSLFTTLKKLAHEEGKTVITSIHQPSSQLFYSFDRLLLIAKGKVAYCGPAKEVVEYFSSVGLHCALHYNPADFIIEMVSQPESRQILIGPDPQESDSLVHRKWWHTFLPLDKLKDYCHTWREARKSPAASADREESEVSSGEVSIQENPESRPKRKEDEERIEQMNGDVPSKKMSNNHSENADIEELPSICVEDGSDSRSEKKDDASSSSGSDQEVISRQEMGNRKWVVPWYWQFLVLAHRNFKQTYKSLLLSWLLWIQTFGALIICGLVWFQIPYEEDTIQDRLGLLFFVMAFWSFRNLLACVGSFPSDRTVVSKERAAGSYRLSAYFLAKTWSEDPMNLVSPLVFISILFPVAGLSGWDSFFSTILLMSLLTFMSQSLGYLLGAVFMAFDKALVLGIVLMLGYMLIGGFFAPTLPFWVQPLSYLSPVTYGYDAILQLNLGLGAEFLCSQTGVSEYPQFCGVNSTLPLNSTFIPGQAVLEALNVEFHLALNLGIVAIFALGFRILAYLSLRFIPGRHSMR